MISRREEEAAAATGGGATEASSSSPSSEPDAHSSSSSSSSSTQQPLSEDDRLAMLGAVAAYVASNIAYINDAALKVLCELAFSASTTMAEVEAAVSAMQPVDGQPAVLGFRGL